MPKETQKPHILFFPLMAHGHMIPLIDMAKLFATRGLKITIVTTPLNVPSISKSIQKTKNSGFEIEIKPLKFSPIDAGLPEGCEHADFITSQNLDLDFVSQFLTGLKVLKDPLEKILKECQPDCVIADMFFPWATDSASKFGIPRLVFHGTSFFSLSTSITLQLFEPYKKVSSDSEIFVVPNLPGNIKLSANKLTLNEKLHGDESTEFAKLLKESRDSELTSFGVIVNSFYELEPVYADYFRNVLGRKAWHIGPVSLCNKEIEEKAQRGLQGSINEHECLKWLNSKKPNSVIYICFGSITSYGSSQLKEIAIALENSKQDFIWVVRKNNSSEEENQDWLPEGFENRMAKKGLIIKGWAPQVLILDNEAIGGFVTHCGWNSTLEGIAAGVPLITCPIGGEQFYNEKLITEILKIGVSGGAQEWSFYGDGIKSECLEKAIMEIMEGEKAEEMKNRAKKLGKMAKEAIEEGGSSFWDFNNLIDDISNYH